MCTLQCWWETSGECMRIVMNQQTLREDAWKEQMSTWGFIPFVSIKVTRCNECSFTTNLTRYRLRSPRVKRAWKVFEDFREGYY